MRQFLIFSLCLLLANVTYAKPVDKGFEFMDLKKIGKIYMKGSMNTGTPAKSGSSPLEVSQDAQQVIVYFLSNLGSLNIVVVDQQGLPVYQKSVNATSGSALSISTRFWSRGNYTIYIGNSQGYMEGEFLIE